MHRYLLFFVLCLSFSLKLIGQDVHFSQKLALNQQRNPALRGNFDGNWRANTVYRSQWRSIGVPFESSAIFFTKQILTSDPTHKYFGGIAYQHDQSGDAELSADFFQMHLGSAKTFGEHTFGIGLSGSLVQKRFDENGLTFPSQYDRSTGGFNEALASGEGGRLGNQLSYFDMGVGIYWQNKIRENLHLTGALSSNHLLEAEESFFGESVKRERSYESQWMARLTLKSGLVLHPYFSYYYSQAISEGLIGSAVSLDFKYWKVVTELRPFLYFRTAPARNTDAAILGATVGLGNLDLGLSYDINISDLELASNYRGGFELSLVYTAPFPQLKKLRIPCVRY